MVKQQARVSLGSSLLSGAAPWLIVGSGVLLALFPFAAADKDGLGGWLLVIRLTGLLLATAASMTMLYQYLRYGSISPSRWLVEQRMRYAMKPRAAGGSTDEEVKRLRTELNDLRLGMVGAAGDWAQMPPELASRLNELAQKRLDALVTDELLSRVEDKFAEPARRTTEWEGI